MRQVDADLDAVRVSGGDGDGVGLEHFDNEKGLGFLIAEIILHDRIVGAQRAGGEVVAGIEGRDRGRGDIGVDELHGVGAFVGGVERRRRSSERGQGIGKDAEAEG